MKPTVPALILIALGTLLLLNNLGYTNVQLGALIAKWWPAILIAVGVSMMFRGGSK